MVAQNFGGAPNDSDAIDELVTGSWRYQVSRMLVAAAEEAGVGDLDLEQSEQSYGAAVRAAIAARFAPTGSHTPVELTFEHHGPPRPGSGAVPPPANKLADYFLAYDAAREGLVYAYSHDYHQFGHAWAFDGSSWSQISERAYRCGSCAQVWSGGYDPARTV